MKNLKFAHEFVEEILQSRKDTTWRIFDDKDLKEGDKLSLVDRESSKEFAQAEIVDIKEKIIKDLTIEELGNHKYKNMEDMITSHRKYYGDGVGENTVIKMITFTILR